MSSTATVLVSIDTEEDNWGSYRSEGATVENIQLVPRLQEVFDRWGARPTYLVNRAPLIDAASVDALGQVAERPGVEIGAHCHPWNTPPLTGEGEDRSMMYRFSVDENRGKVRNVVEHLEGELGVTPRCFRAGRWGFGSTVAEALFAEGIRLDCSVSPFIDWSTFGGPDFSSAPSEPYRFDPASPFEPSASGSMLQIPTTVGFLSGDARQRARLRTALERSALSRFKIIGILDRLGVLARRWLSPETADADTMIRLIDAMLARGTGMLQMTFHSCTLLPGATPFVRDTHDQAAFFDAIGRTLQHCSELGLDFATMSEFAKGFD